MVLENVTFDLPLETYEGRDIIMWGQPEWIAKGDNARGDPFLVVFSRLNDSDVHSASWQHAEICILPRDNVLEGFLLPGAGLGMSEVARWNTCSGVNLCSEQSLCFLQALTPAQSSSGTQTGRACWSRTWPPMASTPWTGARRPPCAQPCPPMTWACMSRMCSSTASPTTPACLTRSGIFCAVLSVPTPGAGGSQRNIALDGDFSHARGNAIRKTQSLIWGNI